MNQSEISPEDLKRSRMIKILVLIAASIIAVMITSCSKVIHATSASGEALEARGNYGYVRLDAIRGKADYNTFLEIYFDQPIIKGEKIVIVPQRYLDSLMATKR